MSITNLASAEMDSYIVADFITLYRGSCQNSRGDKKIPKYHLSP